jgi:hypothetical protein
MTNVVSMREQALDPAVIESIVIKGDLSGLTRRRRWPITTSAVSKQV